MQFGSPWLWSPWWSFIYNFYAPMGFHFHPYVKHLHTTVSFLEVLLLSVIAKHQILSLLVCFLTLHRKICL
jgi:hypothetical protein